MPRTKNVGEASSTAPGGKRKASELQSEYNGKVGLSTGLQALYDRLSKNGTGVSVTRFLHEPTLHRLGLHTIAEALLQRVGLENFLHTSALTYRGYTLEFLATLRERERAVVGEDEETGEQLLEEPGIVFRLNKRERELTYTNLREIFGITKAPDGDFTNFDLNDASRFWTDITGRPNKDKNDKNSLIPHPVLRLLHRFLNMTFFGQGGPTNVNVTSLGLLRAMLPGGVGIPDWVDIFVQSCLSKRLKRAPGLLPMGGMITLICQHLKIKLDSQPCVPGHHLYDIDGLVELKMLTVIDRERGLFNWCWGVNGIPYMRLPRSSTSPLPLEGRPRHFFVPPDSAYANSVHMGAQQEEDQEEPTQPMEDEEPTQDIGPSSQSQPPPTFQFDQTWEGFPSRMDAYVSQVTPWMAGINEWRAQQDQRWVAMSAWQEQQNQHWEAMNTWRAEQTQHWEAMSSWQAEQTQLLSNVNQWHQYHDEDMEEARAHYTLDHDIIASLSNFSLGDGNRDPQTDFTTRLGAFEHQREVMRERRERRRRGRGTHDPSGASGSSC